MNIRQRGRTIGHVANCKMRSPIWHWVSPMTDPLPVNEAERALDAEDDAREPQGPAPIIAYCLVGLICLASLVILRLVWVLS